MTPLITLAVLAVVMVLLSPRVFYRIVVALVPNTTAGHRASRLLAAYRGDEG